MAVITSPICTQIARGTGIPSIARNPRSSIPVRWAWTLGSEYRYAGVICIHLATPGAIYGLALAVALTRTPARSVNFSASAPIDGVEAEGFGKGWCGRGGHRDAQVSAVVMVARMVIRFRIPYRSRLAAVSSRNVMSWWCTSMDQCSRTSWARFCRWRGRHRCRVIG